MALVLTLNTSGTNVYFLKKMKEIGNKARTSSNNTVPTFPNTNTIS
jgi:hypothetical protein